MWSLLRGTCFVRLAFFFCFDFINTVLDVFLVGTDASQTTDRMKEQKHSICYMILPEGIREDLDEGLKALSEKHAKDKRMATVEERTVAAAQILKSKTNDAVSFELVEGTRFSPILPRLEKALAK